MIISGDYLINFLSCCWHRFRRILWLCQPTVNRNRPAPSA